jgi:hypothetical protein
LAWLYSVFALKGDDRRWDHVALTAWSRAPLAVVAAFTPVHHSVFHLADARAAGDVVGEGHFFLTLKME